MATRKDGAYAVLVFVPPFVLAIGLSQPRAVSAIIVSVGCLSLVDGKALPPNT